MLRRSDPRRGIVSFSCYHSSFLLLNDNDTICVRITIYRYSSKRQASLSSSTPTAIPATTAVSAVAPVASIRIAGTAPSTTSATPPRRTVIAFSPPRWRAPTGTPAVVTRAPAPARRRAATRRVAAWPITPVLVYKPAASASTSSASTPPSTKRTLRSRARRWRLAVSVRLSETIGRGSPGCRTAAEAPSRQHDRNIDGRAVNLRFVHVCDRALGVRRGGIQHVCYTTIRQELPVDRHFQVLDVAVAAEDLAQVCFVDVFRELFNDDFRAAWLGAVRAGWAC